MHDFFRLLSISLAILRAHTELHSKRFDLCSAQVKTEFQDDKMELRTNVLCAKFVNYSKSFRRYIFVLYMCVD